MIKTANEIKISNRLLFEEYRSVYRDIEKLEQKIINKKKKNEDIKRNIQTKYYDNVVIFNQITRLSTTSCK